MFKAGCRLSLQIYKSTKCNDVLSSGYCPRGPFCAFAHADSEMTLGRNYLHATAAASGCTTAGANQQTAALAGSPRQQQPDVASSVSSSSSPLSSTAPGLFSPTAKLFQGTTVGGGGAARVSPAHAGPSHPSHMCTSGRLTTDPRDLFHHDYRIVKYLLAETSGIFDLLFWGGCRTSRLSAVSLVFESRLALV